MKSVQIQELKNGGILEMVNRELQLIADDVANVNKKADSKRSLTLKLDIEPTIDGQFGKITVNVSSTLGKQKPLEGSLYFGYNEDTKTGIVSERVIPTLPIQDITIGDEGGSN